ncbi:DNA cytosine methyltransferase, partial [Clostridium sp.]|uniref:DNA cytosine methyltransferase n=1 Tax=Clostridium sp. TaxID=1506 RepID=UPI00359F1AE9
RTKCIRCGSENLEKTRSSLLVEYLRSIRELKPKYFVYENVKNIVGKKFKDVFDLFEKELNEYGYNTYWKVLNAKNYGVSQNRERVFVIGIRKDIDSKRFVFPEGFNNGIRLKDILENNVDRKYYINEHFLNQIKNTKYKTNKIHKEDTLKLINSEFNNLLIMDYRYDEGLRIRKNNLCPTLTTRGRSSVSGVPIIYDNKK